MIVASLLHLVYTRATILIIITYSIQDLCSLWLEGPFLNVVASDLLNVAGWRNMLPKILYTSAPSKTPRLHLFAAHDNNVIILLKALGVYTNQAPNYSAAVGFELRKKDGQYYVTVSKVLEVMKLLRDDSWERIPYWISLHVVFEPANQHNPLPSLSLTFNFSLIHYYARIITGNIRKFLGGEATSITHTIL